MSFLQIASSLGISFLICVPQGEIINIQKIHYFWKTRVHQSLDLKTMSLKHTKPQLTRDSVVFEYIAYNYISNNFTLFRERREDRCLKFAIKSLNNPTLAG